MNSSGIYRKIDELGRIVIPVEIRKILNIKEGDSLEFSVIDKSINLKKKSIVQENISLLKEIEKLMRSTIDGEYIITDREKILISSNVELVDTFISTSISNLLEVYDEYSIIKDLSVSSSDLYIFPYYIDNIKSGFIILYSINEIAKYIKLIKFIGLYINNKLSLN